MDGKHRFGWAVLGAATGVLLFAGWITFGVGGDAATRAVDDFGTAAAALIAGAAAVTAAVKTSGRTRHAWALLAAAMVSWAAGELTWSWYEVVVHRTVPNPSPADIDWLWWLICTRRDSNTQPSDP